MRLIVSILGVLASLLLCNPLHAQGVNGPQLAYEELPTVDAAPPSDAKLTIVPPMRTPASLDGAVIDAQPWTPGGAVHSTNVPLVHSIAAEPWDGGWFGAVELTMLQPSYTRGGMTLDEDSGFVGPRLILGWESDRGLGLRTRFWGLESESDLLTDMGGPIDFTLLASRFDFDVYRRFAFRGSSVTVGASVTGAHLEADFDSALLIEEDGAGVGFFVEGRHMFYQSDAVEWAVISRGRWAGLVGEWRDEFRTGLIKGDANIDIFEAALGMEFKRKFDCADLIVQYMIEGQSWDATYVGDVGYLGSTLSIGFAR